jgi:lipopolysaccharide export system permease protein
VKLLDRYLAREILLPFGAGVLFLTQLLLATQILAQAKVLFGSAVSLVDVGAVILFMMPHFLGYVLPIAFLLGAVLGVARLSDDREVVALGAAGISSARLVPVPVALGALVGALGVWLSLQVEPVSLEAARARLVEVVKKNVRSDVKAGTFYDQITGYVLYAQRVRGSEWENVLVSDRSDPNAAVLALARRGRLEPVGQGQDMQLVLEGGEVHREDTSGDAGAEDYVVAEFERGEMVLGIGSVFADRSALVRASSDTIEELSESARQARERGDLATARRAEGTLHRKIAAPLAVLPFALLAVPLGAARRGGRAFGIGATIAAVVGHYLLLRLGEVLAQRGVGPAAVTVQLPNLALGAVGLVLVWLQVRRGAGAVR